MGDHVVLSPEGVVLVTSPGTVLSYPRPPQSLKHSGMYASSTLPKHDSVGLTLPWTVLARFGVPHNMILVICQFHDGMRECVRLNDRVCSGMFAVEQGLRQGCVLAPLLFNIFFAAVINVASTCFKADKRIMDALIHLRKKRGAGERGKVTAGESVLATLLWGML